MKKAQLIGIAIAGVCGLGAFWLMKGILNKPRVQKEEVQTNTVKVLVARSDISLGSLTTDQHFRWQEYPEAAVPAGGVSCRTATCSMREYTGGIARVPILKEELITRTKIVKSGEGGVLASILPQGMRAISTKISEESAVGRLILPNDHVDIILIRRLRGGKGAEEHVSDTLFRNVRVLAIGQRIEMKEGAKNADGNTATLELTPRQAELLALAKSMGEISLALRSVADFEKNTQQSNEAAELNKKQDRGNAIKILRYGVKSRAYGVN
ncbi:MAG: Flp pilus assembly protein CpaB [Hyphomicrobiaceae bacterium]